MSKEESQFVAGEDAMINAMLSGEKIPETFMKGDNRIEDGDDPNDDDTQETEEEIAARKKLEEEGKTKKDEKVLEDGKSEEEKLIFAKLESLKSDPANKDKSEDELIALLQNAKDDVEDDDKSSLNKDKNEKPEFDVNSFVKEKTGGKFESFDKVLEMLNKEPEKPKYSERVQKLIDLDNKGIDIVDVLKYESLGIDNLDPLKSSDALELVKQNMRLSEDMSEEEISLILKRKYTIEEGDEEEEDSKLKTFELIREAKKAKQKLLDKKKELELPKSESQASVEQQKEQLLGYQKKWEQDVENIITPYEKEIFELSKDDKFEFDVTPYKDSLKATTNGLFNLSSRYIKPDGSSDMKKLRRDMLILDNFDTIVKSVYGQTKSRTLKSVVQGWKNPSSKETGKSGDIKIKSMDDQILDQMGK